MSITFVIIGLILLITIFIIILYNRLITLKNNRENAFADIDVQLKQRYNLIPQLVETIKGYLQHEEKVLTEVTNARTQANQAQTIDEKIQADIGMTQALKGLNIAVEAYPDLKSNQNFQQLQTELSDLENKIAAARRFFNSATKELNTAIQMFPSNLIAGIFNFKEETMFSLGDNRSEIEKAPEVKF